MGRHDLRLGSRKNTPSCGSGTVVQRVSDARPTGQKQFDYVDPRNRDYQIEMERIATAHLKRRARLQPHFKGSSRSRGISGKGQRHNTGSKSRGRTILTPHKALARAPISNSM
jgi:hypothetical protein